MKLALALSGLAGLVLVAIYFALKARRRSDHGHGKEGCDGPDQDGEGGSTGGDCDGGGSGGDGGAGGD